MRHQQLEEEKEQSVERRRSDAISLESLVPAACPRMRDAMSRISKQRWRSATKRAHRRLRQRFDHALQRLLRRGVDARRGGRLALLRGDSASIAVRKRGIGEQAREIRELQPADDRQQRVGPARQRRERAAADDEQQIPVIEERVP